MRLFRYPGDAPEEVGAPVDSSKPPGGFRVLREMRVRLEVDDALVADLAGPVRAEPAGLQRRTALAHLFRDLREVVLVGRPIVSRVLAGGEHPAERMALVHGPCHDERVCLG